MVKAGPPVDDYINQLLPYLEKGDLIIDGGNSLFTDSNRRTQFLKEKGLLFIGTGISGGEEGARHGPSIMPGGNPEAWPLVKNIFQSISAKADNGEPCCDWVGDEERDIMSKWYIMGLNMVICSLFAKPILF